MKTGISSDKDSIKKTLAAIAALPGTHVLVGIPNANAERDEEEQGPINNAALGYIHEFGAPEVNIPARPFLLPGVKSAAKKIENYMGQAGKASLAGDKGKAARAFDAAGLIAVNAVRKRLNVGPFEPLKPGTLAARRRRGRTGTKPLLDTGQMRNSITYVVVKK